MGLNEAVVRLAGYLLSLDRFDEAETLIRGAVADDPRNGEFEKFSYRIAVCRKLATQDAGAKEAIAKHPSDPAPYRLLFSSYMARQKSVEAAQLFGQLLSHIEVTPEEIANTAHAFADQGEAYLVEPFLEANARRHPADGILLYQAACLHALAQHPEAAFRDLAAALAMKDGERIRAALAEDASWSAYRESEGFRKAQEMAPEKALATPARKK